ncbi:NgoFVII family restriction endonuclease [Parabacteroides merdae]|nr:NgoFVII family restriction endonuclease [Parabacteroides merdae]
MKVQFIAQGIPESIGTPAGDVINNALLTTNYNSFAAFVAFVSVDGINQLKESFKQFIDSGGQIRLYVGVDLHGTSKEALELLLSLDNVKTYIVYSSNRIIYHPKIYSFEGDNNNMVMVGSSNLTLSGLYQNIEASLCITNEGEDEQDKNFVLQMKVKMNKIKALLAIYTIIITQYYQTTLLIANL